MYQWNAENLTSLARKTNYHCKELHHHLVQQDGQGFVCDWALTSYHNSQDAIVGEGAA